MNKTISLILLTTLFGYADTVRLTDVGAKYNASSTVDASQDFKQHIGLGFANTTGNTDTLNSSFEYSFTYTTLGYNDQELKLAFDSSAYISENDNIRDNEEYKAWLRMEQMVYDGWFGYFSTRWLRNKFRNYDSKTAIGVGIGKELFKNDTQSLKLTLGVSYNFEKYSDNTPDDDFAALTQYIEYSNQINDISSIYLKLGAMENFEDFSNDYELSMVAGIRFAVAKSLNLSLESELDYDNSPSAGYDKTDTKILVKLGYDF